jgi:hypothetical protein
MDAEPPTPTPLVPKIIFAPTAPRSLFENEGAGTRICHSALFSSFVPDVIVTSCRQCQATWILLIDLLTGRTLQLIGLEVME